MTTLTDDIKREAELRDTVAKLLSTYGVKQNIQNAHPLYVALAAAEARGAARERERCALVARCHSDDRPRRYSMDWNDGYIDGCRGASAAIMQKEAGE